jgi:hypothetical protein
MEDAVRTLIGQRVFGMALGYEDLNDHESLRHDAASGWNARRCASALCKHTLPVEKRESKVGVENHSSSPTANFRGALQSPSAERLSGALVHTSPRNSRYPNTSRIRD